MKSLLLCILTFSLFVRGAAGQSDTLLPFPVFQHQIETLSDSARFERFYDYSVTALNQNNYPEAALATNGMLQIAQPANNRIQLGRTYMAMGNMERNQNNPTNAISHYLKAQSIFNIGGSSGRCNELRGYTLVSVS